MVVGAAVVAARVVGAAVVAAMVEAPALLRRTVLRVVAAVVAALVVARVVGAAVVVARVVGAAVVAAGAPAWQKQVEHPLESVVRTSEAPLWQRQIWFWHVALDKASMAATIVKKSLVFILWFAGEGQKETNESREVRSRNQQKRDWVCLAGVS